MNDPIDLSDKLLGSVDGVGRDDENARVAVFLESRHLVDHVRLVILNNVGSFDLDNEIWHLKP